MKGKMKAGTVIEIFFNGEFTGTVSDTDGVTVTLKSNEEKETLTTFGAALEKVYKEARADYETKQRNRNNPAVESDREPEAKPEAKSNDDDSQAGDPLTTTKGEADEKPKDEPAKGEGEKKE